MATRRHEWSWHTKLLRHKPLLVNRKSVTIIMLRYCKPAGQAEAGGTALVFQFLLFQTYVLKICCGS